MIIKNAKYHNGCTHLDKCPAERLPEFAFIGRSNVGKSSLINMLTNNSKLAQTSNNPGKTVLINHFIINGEWFLVDLPGYGYAARAKSQKAQFTRMIEDYILHRPNLDLLFVLIDGNIPPQKIDIAFINWLGENGVPFNIIFTKCDKSGRNAYQKNIKAMEDTLRDTWDELPQRFVTSSTKTVGRNELLDHIDLTIRNLHSDED